MRALRLAVVAGVLTLIIGSSARAGAAPGGGCPSAGGWELWTVANVLSYLGLAEVPPSMDGNGDGLTCIRQQELANGRKGWTAVQYRDNTVK